jgi:hypothetical protein
MEPNVKTAFDEILKRLDLIDGRCDCLEKTSADSESARKEQGSASERHIAVVEEALSELVEASKGEIRGLEEFRAGADVRLESLEQFCVAQFYSTIVVDNWGHEIELHVKEIENRVGDLKLAHLRELYGKDGDRVATLEATATVIEEWWPYVDGSIDDMRLEINCRKQTRDRTLLEPGSVQPGVEISPSFVPVQSSWDRNPMEPSMADPGAEFSHTDEPVARFAATGVFHDWPDGHGFAHVARERGFGSVTTLVPSSNNGKIAAPPAQFNSGSQMMVHVPLPSPQFTNPPVHRPTQPIHIYFCNTQIKTCNIRQLKHLQNT